jgi:hypothetical protein
MGIKRVFSRFSLHVYDGYEFPPFYYGFSYFDEEFESIIFHVWPINLVVRVAHALRRAQTDGWYFIVEKQKMLKERGK